MTAAHEPVLLDRVVALLSPSLQSPGSLLVDATLGLGGHAEAVLERCPDATVLGLDRDPQALEIARERLIRFPGRVRAVHRSYDQLCAVAAERGLHQVDAVLFDLGVSSMQLDQPGRGFSYAVDAPLDMRMDPTAARTAADVVNGCSGGELARILREYGEERFAARIAAAVVRARASEPFVSSAQLVAVIRDSIPAAARRSGGHPAKRVFQALRIEVNDELAALHRALPQAIAAIGVGGRVVVLAYHSLEDRLVKQEFVRRARVDIPPDVPVVRPPQPELRLLTRRAEKADTAEIGRNPRARSVRLRAVERVRTAVA